MLSPWDADAVIASAERTGRLVVVHEDNHTCGFGAEVIATVAEKSKRPVVVRRVTRPDTFIPCHFEDQLAVLPSFRRVLESCAELLDLEVTWERPVVDEATDMQPVRAIGSGPADETVDVVGLLVQVGDTVTVGQLVAEVEATKSVVEVASTVAGVVSEVSVTLGQTIPVGGVLLRIRTADASIEPPRPQTREDAGTPRLHERSRLKSSPHAPREGSRTSRDADRAINPQSTINVNRALGYPHAEREGYVELVGIASVSGSRIITNDKLLSLAKFPTPYTSDDIVKKTGIESRPWVDPTNGETVFTLAVAATKRLLEQQALSIHDIGLVIASTTTPDQVTPSLACRVAAALGNSSSQSLRSHVRQNVGDSADDPRSGERGYGLDAMSHRGPLTLPAYDINAACSGYLYALAQAFDFLQHEPTARVLVITSEVLSPLLDLTDFDTAPLFADAATATLIVGQAARLPIQSDHATGEPFVLRLHRPVLSGHPEDGSRLSVPLCGTGSIQMRGQTVFTEAVRAMSETLATACARAGLSIDDLDQIIPHQANQRILDAVAKRTAAPVFSNIRRRGNSSSSTIPLALADLINGDSDQGPQRFGLATFGGGFTFGAAVITWPHQQQSEPVSVSPQTNFVRDVSGA